MRTAILSLTLLIGAPAPQVQPVDYSICAVIHPPPLGKPHRRVSGLAPVSSLV